MKIAASALIALLLWAGFGFRLPLAGAAETESPPSRRTLYLGQEIYQVNCAVCHGVAGDGNGPAASMFRIRPRDFRPGLYKFRSTPSGSLPTDDDLFRTVSHGLRWTGMIGRSNLGESNGNAVIQFIKTFSPRFVKAKPGKPIAVPSAPGKTQEILAEGKRLYKEVGCDGCHGEQGRGDGPSAGALKDDWGWKIWPSDLTWRPLKRGSDTRETYLTIVTGLSGTPMPAYASSLNSRQVWSLVYYLESLVPPDHRLDPNQVLGEEQQGWMAVRMGGMMGGMMGRGMMYRSR
jgi:mono/diheme cytochrome c family protein